MTLAVIIQVFAALGGIAGVSSLINLVISRKKLTAETTDTSQNTNDKMIKNLEGDNDQLRKDIKAIREEIEQVRISNEKLHDQLEELEWQGVESRRSMIAAANWMLEAMAKFNELNVEFREPPHFSPISKRP